MRVMFAGTPAVALPSLRAIHGSGHDLTWVLTRPPAPVGRKRRLTPSPVHSEAMDLGLPVLTGAPNSPEVLAALADIDCVAVVAYGALIREPALSLPTHGWVNLHFSLLPQWRGAAPVQHAIMAGQETTGVSVFQIEHGLDTGPLYHRSPYPIGAQVTAGELLEELAEEGAPLLLRTLDEIAAGAATATPQVGMATLAPTLHSRDGRINWSRPAAEIDARIRGLTPAPGAWTTSTTGGRFKIGPVTLTTEEPLVPGRLRPTREGVVVGTGTLPVRLGHLAPPGRPWMDAAAWSRGLHGEDLMFEGDE